MVEHLNIFKIILEKAAKYLLLPGLALDVNLNIRVCFLPCTVVTLFTCLWYTFPVYSQFWWLNFLSSSLVEPHIFFYFFLFICLFVYFLFLFPGCCK
jgi:hypothetical protein